MPEIYRKEGRIVRYENGRVIFVREAGEAVEDGLLFRCAPSGAGVTLPELSDERVRAAAAEIERLAAPHVRIERLLVTEGSAAHTFAGKRWEEQTFRIHAALVSGTTRVIIDLGDDDLADLREIVEALPRVSAPREAPQRIRLRPAVGAALLPSLAGIAPPNVTLSQTAGGFDGKGGAIAEQTLTAPPWPNWYRPSYRVRPVRMPMNLRLTAPVEPDETEMPRAIALLEPPDGLTLRVLCVDGREVFPAVVHVTRIESVSAASRWYPYAAGSFGAEMVL